MGQSCRKQGFGYAKYDYWRHRQFRYITGKYCTACCWIIKQLPLLCSPMSIAVPRVLVSHRMVHVYVLAYIGKLWTTTFKRIYKIVNGTRTVLLYITMRAVHVCCTLVRSLRYGPSPMRYRPTAQWTPVT